MEAVGPEDAVVRTDQDRPQAAKGEEAERLGQWIDSGSDHDERREAETQRIITGRVQRWHLPYKPRHAVSKGAKAPTNETTNEAKVHFGTGSELQRRSILAFQDRRDSNVGSGLFRAKKAKQIKVL